MFYFLLAIQLITFGYHQMTTRFDFFPFNGVKFYSTRERKIEIWANGFVMAFAIVLSILKHPVSVGISGGIWTIILVGAVLNWWIPYVTGREIYKMTKHESWGQVYERIFSKTIHILPHIQNHPRPNLEHMILHFLILCSAISSWTFVLNEI